MSQDEGSDATYQEHESSRPEWTIMIYLAGDNNLSAQSIDILQELEAACPPSEDVRVLACFDANTPRPRGARYLEINHRRFDNPNGVGEWGLHNDLVPLNELEGPPVEMPNFCKPDPPSTTRPTEPVAKEGLSRFLKFALKNHPAKRYMLILFGHGSAVAGNTFLIDNNPPSFLRLKEFADVLARHFDCADTYKKPKLDILACDNCMMNGIETAHELRKQVDYILGSQGLMLAVGWPFRTIIEAIVSNKCEETKVVAHAVLRSCARSLLDFSLMDRSSEQAICDLTTLRKDKNLVTNIRKLVAAMEEGLEFDDYGRLRYPEIRDAIRLARLEAQSYFREMFVDLYDFCMLLVDRCNDAICRPIELFEQVQELKQQQLSNRNSSPPSEDECVDEVECPPEKIKKILLRLEVMKLFKEIATRAWIVLEEIKEIKEDIDKDRTFVRRSYYVGPELQYSNGVSIYFPWTLPEGPIIFEPAGARTGEGAGGSYGLSWASFDRVRTPPDDYIFKTAFDEYKEYDFAQCGGGNWAAFLERFFRATLRDVRRGEFKYEKSNGREFFKRTLIDESNRIIRIDRVSLQKSSSDTDSEEDCTCPTIKNYPRRFYLSPADCAIMCDLPDDPQPDTELDSRRKEDDDQDCVSYLGWHIRGLVEEVIAPQQPLPSSSTCGTDDTSESEPKGEPENS